MNNLLIKYKSKNIFQKFISPLKNAFKKASKPEIKVEIKNQLLRPIIAEKYKVEGIVSTDIKSVESKTMQEIIDIIENNPEALEKLSIKKLELIDQYYIDKINQYRQMLDNMA